MPDGYILIAAGARLILQVHGVYNSPRQALKAFKELHSAAKESKDRYDRHVFSGGHDWFVAPIEKGTAIDGEKRREWNSIPYTPID